VEKTIEIADSAGRKTQKSVSRLVSFHDQCARNAPCPLSKQTTTTTAARHGGRTLTTSHLGANAQGGPRALPRDDHSLHLQTVAEPQQKLGSPIVGPGNERQGGHPPLDLLDLLAVQLLIQGRQLVDRFRPESLLAPVGGEHVQYRFVVVPSKLDDRSKELRRINPHPIAVPNDLRPALPPQDRRQLILAHR
jgi:hypothetical protein